MINRGVVRCLLRRVLWLSVLMYAATAHADAYVRNDAGRTFRPAPDETAKALYLIIKERQSDRRHEHFTSAEVELFYGKRGYRPLWSRALKVHLGAYELETMIAECYKEGLNPENSEYHLRAIRHLIYQGVRSQTAMKEPEKLLARLDMLLTEAFFALGYHLFYGLAYGLDISAMHHNGKKSIDMAELLHDAIVNNAVAKSLAGLSPRTLEYLKLKQALAQYEQLLRAGGWSVKAADYNTRNNGALDAIKTRLQLSEDLISVGTLSSGKLTGAIKRFQRRHKIAADGIVGKVTADKMAIPVSVYIKKIQLNMERWRWRKEPMERDYIVVNIPDFRLVVVEKKRPVLSMRVVVGKESRKTPTFDARMSHLVLNPYWYIPKTILNEDIIPAVQNDSSYLERRGIELFSHADDGEMEWIDDSEIFWDGWYEGDEKNYVFRQNPGARNPLGRVKFIFPNAFNIYFHDTPSRKGFHNGKNMASSGCIRLEKPLTLARYILKRERSRITYGRMLKLLKRGDAHRVSLRRPLAVYITYQSVWIEGEDGLNLREDVYGFDESLDALLGERLPEFSLIPTSINQAYLK